MFGVGAVQFEFGFQRNTIGQAALNAFFYTITWRVNEVIKKFQYKVVTGIRDRKILGKHFVKTFIDTIFRVGFQLEKIPE
jgi:hypothetical protein